MQCCLVLCTNMPYFLWLCSPRFVKYAAIVLSGVTSMCVLHMLHVCKHVAELQWSLSDV